MQATITKKPVFIIATNQNEFVQQLIDSVKQKDIHACKQLYMQYADAMYSICFRFTNNAVDAEDLLQEAFMKIFDKIETFKNESTVGAWIKQIVVNHCLNFVRKKKVFLKMWNR